MRIERIDAASDAEGVRSCYEIYLAGAPIDDPVWPPMSPRTFGVWLRHGWNEDPRELWLGRDGSGAPVGWYLLALPERENKHLAGLDVYVEPARRRAGLGSELVRAAIGRARLAGRTVLSGDAREGGAGIAFALWLGGRIGLTEIRRMQEIGAIPEALRSEVAATAGQYSMVAWEGEVPEEYLADMVTILGATADIPRDAGHDPEVWDADRIRQSDQRRLEQGVRSYVVAARSLATGELAAMTEVVVDPDLPEWGYQNLTAVARPHRGRKLGLAVKIAMLDRLAEREPGLKRMLTGNADGNAAMIAINEKLGYRELDRWPALELDLATA